MPFRRHLRTKLQSLLNVPPESQSGALRPQRDCYLCFHVVDESAGRTRPVHKPPGNSDWFIIHSDVTPGQVNLLLTCIDRFTLHRRGIDVALSCGTTHCQAPADDRARLCPTAEHFWPRPTSLDHIRPSLTVSDGIRPHLTTSDRAWLCPTELETPDHALSRTTSLDRV